jgi:hypothetical protein
MAAGTLTEALVRLHGAGRADTYGAALLDVAQDHLLWLLAELGHFDDGTLVFKGGTALRKCRLGSGGRFSTDLDFVAPDDDTVLEVCESIDGASVAGFQYSLQSTRGDGRHWTMQVRHPSARPARCRRIGGVRAAAPDSAARAHRLRSSVYTPGVRDRPTGASRDSRGGGVRVEARSLPARSAWPRRL